MRQRYFNLKAHFQFIFRRRFSNTETVQMSFLNKLTFNFHADDPTVFVKSQWQKSEKSFPFLIYRWVLTGLYIFIVIYGFSFLKGGNFFIVILFFTNWGLILCMITTSFAMILTTLHYYDRLNLSDHCAVYKTYWFLSNITTVFAFLITLIYYAVIVTTNCNTLFV